MTPELWKMLRVAVVGFLGAAAGLFKVWTELAKVKADREATRTARDADSQSLHDTVLKHGFLIQQTRDELALYRTVQDDIKSELGILNTNVARLGVLIEGLQETVKELKKNV